MIRLSLRFPAGRYHGTAWGRHVNEGVPEWPPSPYRLLRALFDAWKRKCDHLEESKVRSLFTALASREPVFHLPQGVAAHTRSYLSSNKMDPTAKSLIFDAFVAVAYDAQCIIEWDIALDADGRAVLAELSGALNYLGRSESWIEVAPVEEIPEGRRVPCRPASTSGAEGELVRVACPLPASEFRGKGDWFEGLTYSSARVTKEKLNDPPAMRKVLYTRPEDALVTWLPRVRESRPTGVDAAILELDSRVLPRATEALSIADEIRCRLMGAHKDLERRDKARVSPLFSGKDASGKPLTGEQHLFIWPEPDEHSGKVSRIRLAAPRDLTEKELQAVLGVTKLGQFEDHPVRVTMSWRGRREDPVFARPARCVTSATPFAPSRFLRRKQMSVQEFLEREVARECGFRGLPAPVRVTKLDRIEGTSIPLALYRRARKGEAPRIAYALELEFAEEVRAPFAIGYHCHFGLGQFREKG